MYAPQIVFLHCGGSSSIPLGIWYHYSFGTIAMYKHDWENFGGFSQDFRDKETWGGEDWDLIDSAVKGGLEIERKRSPCVYHYIIPKKECGNSEPQREDDAESINRHFYCASNLLQLLLFASEVG